MTTHTATAEVSTHIEVQAPIAHVFDVFTGQIGSWWDTDHHILGAPLAEMIFERYVGGHIIDRGIDGSQSRWARVLAYEPPTRVCFSWDINLHWQLESDPAETSEVEIVFTELSPDRTHVALTHRHLDRHGEGWESMRDAVAAGWDLHGFAAAVTRAFVRPDVDATVWEHGRRNMQLVQAGLLPIVLPVTDDSDIAGFAIFAATPEDTRTIMERRPRRARRHLHL